MELELVVMSKQRVCRASMRGKRESRGARLDT